jgi:hypothetical protein
MWRFANDGSDLAIWIFVTWQVADVEVVIRQVADPPIPNLQIDQSMFKLKIED